ncbi:transglycosylase SLT domain-containing protein [Pseudoduganella eburnea]|uniref:Transglycosylase SLT domain-containing protein n=1 Tax=Massilia eburnea TaxID=1776165 RepID=A0A6L6Q9C0_9BURK|nr:transglycosylase SLT domain-containing protein [Massilia eburnea]MTW09068.1 transglycosylase SLT domain-containing protein [Massilia eburnea]
MQDRIKNAVLIALALSAAVPAASAFAAAEAPKSVVLQPAVEDYKETDVWGRIRSGYAIPDVNNALVAKHIKWYADRQDYIDRTTARASLYLYHVVEELEKRNMPTELALLPFIESAFNPQALSNANAAGLWQFVPGTGRDYDLKQNAFKDDRRSVLASTDAALSYLQRLYTMFGDWQLALAAYNWGEGNVQKAVARNRAAGKPTDFESLSELMPAETRNYVPKLQAVKNIVANPAQYAVHLPVIDNEPYFTAIDKTRDIDLALAAKFAEISVDEFKALNPQFKKPVITGNEQTKILLPTENAAKFAANLASWTHALSSWTTHKISSARESIASLARKFGTTPDAIRQANNIPQRSVLKAGSTILVPTASAAIGPDISADIIENAALAVDTERAPKRSNYRQASSSRSDSKPAVSMVKARVKRDEAGKSKSHRSN